MLSNNGLCLRAAAQYMLLFLVLAVTESLLMSGCGLGITLPRVDEKTLGSGVQVLAPRRGPNYSSKKVLQSNKHLQENRIRWLIGLMASCVISSSPVGGRRVLLPIIKSSFYKCNIGLGQSYFLNQSAFLRFFSSQSGFLT